MILWMLCLEKRHPNNLRNKKWKSGIRNGGNYGKKKNQAHRCGGGTPECR